MDSSPRGRKESDTTERLSFTGSVVHRPATLASLGSLPQIHWIPCCFKQDHPRYQVTRLASTSKPTTSATGFFGSTWLRPVLTYSLYLLWAQVWWPGMTWMNGLQAGQMFAVTKPGSENWLFAYIGYWACNSVNCASFHCMGVCFGVCYWLPPPRAALWVLTTPHPHQLP